MNYVAIKKCEAGTRGGQTLKINMSREIKMLHLKVGDFVKVEYKNKKLILSKIKINK